MHRAARSAETLTEFVALLACEVRHRQRVAPRRSQAAIVTDILRVVEMPDLRPALENLRFITAERARAQPAKPMRKTPGQVIKLDQPA